MFKHCHFEMVLHYEFKHIAIFILFHAIFFYYILFHLTLILPVLILSFDCFNIRISPMGNMVDKSCIHCSAEWISTDPYVTNRCLMFSTAGVCLGCEAVWLLCSSAGLQSQQEQKLLCDTWWIQHFHQSWSLLMCCWWLNLPLLLQFAQAKRGSYYMTEICFYEVNSVFCLSFQLRGHECACLHRGRKSLTT